MAEFSRILVPLDGSEVSEHALPYALALAKKFDSSLILMRVLDVALPVIEARQPEYLWSREAQQYSHREVRMYLEKVQAELAAQGIHVRTVVREQSPAEDILEVAASEQIDLIVMSSHGQGTQYDASSPWTSGSIADKVMQHSPCPVLLVRPQPAQASR